MKHLFSIPFPTLIILSIMMGASVGIVMGEEETSCDPISPLDKGDGPSGLLPPEISIELDHDFKEVDVSPGSDGVVTFDGTVYCDMPPATPPGQECMVFLIADAGGWAVDSIPAIAFSRTKTQERISIDVQVPPETSSSLENELEISAKWRYEPGIEQGYAEGTNAEIIITPYCNLTFTSEKPVMRAPVGEWAKFSLILKNEGNTDTNITLEVTVEDGVEYEIESNTIIIREQGEYEISLRAKQKSGLAGSNPISIKAKSPHEGQRNEVTFGIYLKTENSARALLGNPIFYIISSTLILVAIAVSIIVIKRKKRMISNNYGKCLNNISGSGGKEKVEV